MRQRLFDRTNFKPRKMLENAQTPTIMTPLFLRGSGASCVGQFYAMLQTENAFFACCNNTFAWLSDCAVLMQL